MFSYIAVLRTQWLMYVRTRRCDCMEHSHSHRCTEHSHSHCCMEHSHSRWLLQAQLFLLCMGASLLDDIADRVLPTSGTVRLKGLRLCAGKEPRFLPKMPCFVTSYVCSAAVMWLDAESGHHCAVWNVTWHRCVT